MDADDSKTLADIEKYGCQVISIMEEGDLPPFAYSVGIQKKTGKPEAVVIGLKHKLAHFMVNEYNRRVIAGEKFEAGQFYAGFIQDFECQVRTVHSSHLKEYFGHCWHLYEGPNFRVIQLVWPTTSGVWPWEEAASEWFRSWQPLLEMPEGN